MSTPTLIVFAVVFVGVFAFEWARARSSSAETSAWEREMRDTPLRDRWRIARAVRAGRRLDNPREARLAVGMAEQQRRQRGSYGIPPKVRLGFGVAILLLGAVAREVAVVGIGAVFVLLALAARAQENRLVGRLERAIELNRDQAALEASPPGQ